MGVCFDCLVTIDGVRNIRACVTPIVEGMVIDTRGMLVADLVAQQTKQSVDTIEWATPRPPVVPIPLDGLWDQAEVM